MIFIYIFNASLFYFIDIYLFNIDSTAFHIPVVCNMKSAEHFTIHKHKLLPKLRVKRSSQC